MLTVASATVAIIYRHNLENLGTESPNSIWNPGSRCNMNLTPNADGVAHGVSAPDCASAGDWSTKSWEFGIGTAVLGAFTAFSIYKAVNHDDTPDEHMVLNGRKHHEPFSITPVVSADRRWRYVPHGVVAW